MHNRVSEGSISRQTNVASVELLLKKDAPDPTNNPNVSLNKENQRSMENVPNNTHSLPVPTLGVSGIVFNQQKQILLIRRNQPPAMGFWSIPGGKLEAGESLAEACQREIKEETGLHTEVKNIVAVVERRVEGFHYVIIDYLALLADEENNQPIAQTDVSEARWISLEHLSDYDLVEGLAEIILRAFEMYNGDHIAGLYDVDSKGSDYILPKVNYP